MPNIFIILIVISLTGCSSIMSMATAKLTDNLGNAILNQDDPGIVRDGAPAYLLMIDAQIAGDPENEQLLIMGARLYGAYASAFVNDQARLERLSGKALAFARRALCVNHQGICAAYQGAYNDLLPLLEELNKNDVPLIYSFASSWAGWVQSNSDNWSALADIPKIEAMMRRVVELDESHDFGGAHIYLGVIASQLPPALGGKPELGRQHFERVIELTDGRHLMAKVLFAEHYARLMFDRELHDALLKQVNDQDPHQPGLTLVNTLAKEQAQELLISADEYF